MSCGQIQQKTLQFLYIALTKDCTNRRKSTCIAVVLCLQNNQLIQRATTRVEQQIEQGVMSCMKTFAVPKHQVRNVMQSCGNAQQSELHLSLANRSLARDQTIHNTPREDTLSILITVSFDNLH